VGETTRRRRLAGILGGLLLVLLAPAGCGAGGERAAYREAAVTALEGALGESRTAELAGRQWVAGRSTHPFASVVVGEGEGGVGAEAGWFEGQQPPTPADDPLRAATVDALDRAEDAVQAVRVSLDRSDVAGTRTALGELRAACTVLEDLAEQLQ
jgi:hypothetical protein